MRKWMVFLLIATVVGLSACSTGGSTTVSDDLVLVEGGSFKSSKTSYSGKDITLSDFYIGKYEVTQKQWADVMGDNPSGFKGEDRPVERVSWYDAIEYCNARSMKENLKPYYTIDKETMDTNNKNENDNVKWTVTINEDANGYRLPTAEEWEYAASGGQKSENFTYSGSNNPDEVAWYWMNAGEKPLTGDWNWPAIENNRNQTKPVGQQKANELGIYDMSGNVREWCWDWHSHPETPDNTWRVSKGGGWVSSVNTEEISYPGKFDANGLGPDQGLRVVRSK
ncbi:Formylglycine-generating enzyme, required for sulfatase activity, contains SUMF1/FGE domain [Paenibacillus polysaccharolyticus]|uniref:Formylglycine-generating enzyme, required for sulfatase activity, contains SUMF1/FGE domain n=1 Tax=Paenibacillus polysaccharolyticus TaxID=582692 RepID=A0A1G5CPX2_9BACL|nr:SUMF1/EgtB/PvdO family nonheme iron enzyme [Paenibacillus polysaccharolyticus]SCY04300.1 Formylglycine-generating enzyme, required for sulfatase activity, contains SUMF1/FGE domain [Paenibacillus polysaccharolyticus]